MKTLTKFHKKNILFVVLGSAFLISVLFYFRMPKSPHIYLTSDRSDQLEDLAKELLGSAEIDTLSITHNLIPFAWDETLNGMTTSRFKDKAVPVLRKNRLHALHVNHEAGFVVYGQYFLRKWYEYIYAPSTPDYRPPRPYSVFRALGNNWHYGIR